MAEGCQNQLHKQIIWPPDRSSAPVVYPPVNDIQAVNETKRLEPSIASNAAGPFF
jgi:hypothetical protein